MVSQHALQVVSQHALQQGGVLSENALQRGGSCSGGGACSGGSAPGGVPAPRGPLWGSLLPGRGCLLPGGVWRPPWKQMATVADGTHPTGVHSCYFIKLDIVLNFTNSEIRIIALEA